MAGSWKKKILLYNISVLLLLDLAGPSKTVACHFSGCCLDPYMKIQFLYQLAPDPTIHLYWTTEIWHCRFIRVCMWRPLKSEVAHLYVRVCGPPYIRTIRWGGWMQLNSVRAQIFQDKGRQRKWENTKREGIISRRRRRLASFYWRRKWGHGRVAWRK
jgi:hypothetical protein